MKKIWHYIVLKITIPTHERWTTPPGFKSPIRVRKVCCMTQPIDFRTYPRRLQYSSQIVETGAICLEFSPNFLHSRFTPLFSLKCAARLPQCWAERILDHWNHCKPKSTLGMEKSHKCINDLKNLRARASRNRTKAAAKTIIQLSES